MEVGVVSCGVVNVSVSNHYSDATSVSDITTQGLLGEQLEVLEEGETHIHVRQADGYQSWIPEDQLVLNAPENGTDILVRSHFIRIYAEPTVSSIGVRDAVIGSKLKAVDEQGGWYRIALPDGSFGWSEKGHFGTIPKFSPQSVVSLAHEFLGYQYFWGGLTPKGFDCSGLVQTVFGLHGVKLLRDSWQQQEHHQLSTDYLDAQPGDLLFFSNKPDRVTHVAISLGRQKYIHASGWVRLDSFNENDDIFEKQRSQSFVSVNRYTSAG